MKYIFENEEYTLSKVPMNWRMEIKLPAKKPRSAIDRIVYSDSDLPESYAHESVNKTIDEHFYRKSDKGYKDAIIRDKKASERAILAKTFKG